MLIIPQMHKNQSYSSTVNTIDNYNIQANRGRVDWIDEWAVGREVEVGIVGLHIGRAVTVQVVIVNTYEKYQLDVYIYDLGTVKAYHLCITTR